MCIGLQEDGRKLLPVEAFSSMPQHLELQIQADQQARAPHAPRRLSAVKTCSRPKLHHRLALDDAEFAKDFCGACNELSPGNLQRACQGIWGTAGVGVSPVSDPTRREARNLPRP